MFELKIITDFSAAHRLKIHNSKCENLHGHNWKIEVNVIGQDLDQNGILLDFKILKTHVAKIMEDLDHKFLNDLDYFPGNNPSSENIALYIAKQLTDLLKDIPVRVARVTAWESKDACATYIP